MGGKNLFDLFKNLEMAQKAFFSKIVEKVRTFFRNFIKVFWKTQFSRQFFSTKQHKKKLQSSCFGENAVDAFFEKFGWTKMTFIAAVKMERKLFYRRIMGEESDHFERHVSLIFFCCAVVCAPRDNCASMRTDFSNKSPAMTIDAHIFNINSRFCGLDRGSERWEGTQISEDNSAI